LKSFLAKLAQAARRTHPGGLLTPVPVGSGGPRSFRPSKVARGQYDRVEHWKITGICLGTFGRHGGFTCLRGGRVSSSLLNISPRRAFRTAPPQDEALVSRKLADVPWLGASIPRSSCYDPSQSAPSKLAKG